MVTSHSKNFFKTKQYVYKTQLTRTRRPKALKLLTNKSFSTPKYSYLTNFLISLSISFSFFNLLLHDNPSWTSCMLTFISLPKCNLISSFLFHLVKTCFKFQSSTIENSFPFFIEPTLLKTIFFKQPQQEKFLKRLIPHLGALSIYKKPKMPI